MEKYSVQRLVFGVYLYKLITYLLNLLQVVSYDIVNINFN